MMSDFGGQETGPRPLRHGPHARDVQGNVLAAFNKPLATFLFVALSEDVGAARAWVAELAPMVATTEEVEDFYERRKEVASGSEPEEAARVSETPQEPHHDDVAAWIGVGLTWHGLNALAPARELGPDLAEHWAFRVGAAARAGDLGDDTQRWIFGADDPKTRPIDAVVTVAADTDADHRRLRDEALAIGERYGAEVVLEQECAVLPGELRGREHFGFKDGISQPAVHGFHAPDPERPGERAGHRGQLLVQPGEFVLGWRREDGEPEAVADWLRNASFQVVRRLDQDVAAWRDAAKAAGDRAERWSAALIGRTPEGAPLAAPDADGEAFDYESDPDGAVTPHFAHIRKVFPRGVHAFEPQRHRLMRRGIPFGPPFQKGDEAAERGMIFNAFMASIERQFEYVQRLFANKPDFPQDHVGPDAVIGSLDRVADYDDDEFNVPDGFDGPVPLQSFVQTRGALYALAPSKDALAWLGAGGSDSASSS
jgi:Dyp-type peroxidase family